MNDKEKFELEFMATSELAYMAQKCKEEIIQLEDKMRRYGKCHQEFADWKLERDLKKNRRKYVLSRIKARQLTLL